MATVNIGIDVGNSDTKSANTTTPSGFLERRALPFGVEEYLKYGENYYIPDEEERFPYKRDKTVDDNEFVLTLFGIAKQLIYKVCNEVNIPKSNPETIQKVIDTYDVINLGVGLPPADCSTLGKKNVQYYIDKFGDGVNFSFKDVSISDREFEFSLRLNNCLNFAQDWAAVVTQRPKDQNHVINKFKSYYAIDIGGYTVDVVPIMNRKPEGAKSTSIDKGILRLYSSISKLIATDFGQAVRPDIIESVLKGDETILGEDVKKCIFDTTQTWVDDIIRSLSDADVLFDSYPIVFLGGGASAFKTYIKKNPAIKKCDFIFGANANAKGYEKLITLASKEVKA